MHVTLLQNLGGSTKKAVVSDAWRNKSVEERLEYSLVKVGVDYYRCLHCLVVVISFHVW